MRLDRAAVRLAVATVALAAVSACQNPGPGPGHPTTSGTRPSDDKILVEYYERGGHCREICPEERATINADGSWAATSGPVATNGTLTAAQLAELKDLIQTQARRLNSLPPSNDDICPSAYDGRDIDITFHTSGREVTVSNCDKDFDGSELLQHTIELVDSFT
jgi:hypothetical protein